MSMAVGSRVQGEKNEKDHLALFLIYAHYSSLPKMKGSLQMAEMLNQLIFSLQPVLSIICSFITPTPSCSQDVCNNSPPHPQVLLTSTTDLIASDENWSTGRVIVQHSGQGD